MNAPSNLSNLVPLFAALADPTRLRLLNLIAGREVCVCYLVEILRLAQPKISRHLAYLRKAGVVTARREGKWMHYSIRQPEGTAAVLILSAAIDSMKADRGMQADLTRLSRVCCEPNRFLALLGAPIPAHERTTVATASTSVRPYLNKK